MPPRSVASRRISAHPGPSQQPGRALPWWMELMLSWESSSSVRVMGIWGRMMLPEAFQCCLPPGKWSRLPLHPTSCCCGITPSILPPYHILIGVQPAFPAWPGLLYSIHIPNLAGEGGRWQCETARGAACCWCPWCAGGWVHLGEGGLPGPCPSLGSGQVPVLN